MFNRVWRPVQRRIGLGTPVPPPRSPWGFIKKILNDWALDFSSLLAYVVLIALLPIAVTAFGIFGLVFNNSSTKQSIIDGIVDSVDDNTTKSAVREITSMASNKLSTEAGGILAIGIIFSIWGGSRLFVAIEKVLTIIYRVPSRTFLKQNLIAIGMLILFIFLVIIMFAAAAVPSFVINSLPDKGGAQFGIFCAGIAVSVLVAFILYLVIYLVMPNKKMKFKHVWCGALLAAILLDIFIVLFPLYIRRFMGSFVGLIGFAVILITFFYYFSVILILGAEINSYFFELIPPLPEGLGTFFSEMVQKVNQGRATIQRFPYTQYPRQQLPVRATQKMHKRYF